jgi:hypothetical protein
MVAIPTRQSAILALMVLPCLMFRAVVQKLQLQPTAQIAIRGSSFLARTLSLLKFVVTSGSLDHVACGVMVKFAMGSRTFQGKAGHRLQGQLA